MESDPLEVMEITADPAAGVGNIAVSGKMTTLTANVRSLLEAEDTKIYGDLRLELTGMTRYSFMAPSPTRMLLLMLVRRA